MGDFTITVKVADRLYRLKIEREQEEIVRKSAEMINEKIKEYAGTYHYNDMRDLLAMAALQITVGHLVSSNEYDDREAIRSEKLKEIDELISMHL